MMKHMQKFRYILMGVLIAVIISQLVTPALAALAKKTIEIYTGVSIYIDDVKLSPKDAQGNPVEPFVYNGTVFLPVRAIGEALGKVVQWDGKTSSAYLGKHEGSTPTVWLKDLDYFTASGTTSYLPSEKDNLGNTHTYVVLGEGSTKTYKLNGQYSKITGTFFQSYEERSSDEQSTFTIYGDGQLLYTATVKGGVEPIPFDVDLSGVLELKIYLDCFTFFMSYHTTYAGLGECGLYT